MESDITDGTRIPVTYCDMTGKVKWSKHGVRLAIIRRMKAVNYRLREYECEYCGWYHMTSSTGLDIEEPERLNRKDRAMGIERKYRKREERKRGRERMNFDDIE